MIGAALFSQHYQQFGQCCLDSYRKKNVQKTTILLASILPLLDIIGPLLNYDF